MRRVHSSATLVSAHCSIEPRPSVTTAARPQGTTTVSLHYHNVQDNIHSSISFYERIHFHQRSIVHSTAFIPMLIHYQPSYSSQKSITTSAICRGVPPPATPHMMRHIFALRVGAHPLPIHPMCTMYRISSRSIPSSHHVISYHVRSYLLSLTRSRRLFTISASFVPFRNRHHHPLSCCGLQLSCTCMVDMTYLLLLPLYNMEQDPFYHTCDHALIRYRVPCMVPALQGATMG